ncbi:MAG TPA: hypothetical protein VN426_03435 [Syntrophomonadaceae bacterium]|nr:hypothetical protein [Syntrophomonadaceae bacterium]
MFIVISNWKKKFLRLLTVILLVVAFAAAFPALTGLFLKEVPVFTSWFQDEQPSGNPMRVEKDQETSQFNQALDRFVIKVQDFYHKE